MRTRCVLCAVPAGVSPLCCSGASWASSRLCADSRPSLRLGAPQWAERLPLQVSCLCPPPAAVCALFSFLLFYARRWWCNWTQPTAPRVNVLKLVKREQVWVTGRSAHLWQLNCLLKSGVPGVTHRVIHTQTGSNVSRSVCQVSSEPRIVLQQLITRGMRHSELFSVPS